MTITGLDSLGTERQNPNTSNIDVLSTRQLLEVINREDKSISAAVAKTIPVIEKVVDHLVPLVKKGGRLFYLGAGTSGRLGVLDASEIPPTYSAPFGQFVGIIAGGDIALRKAVEASEDSETGAFKDLQPYELNPELDTILGIASSGRTPYAIGALKYGKSIGCTTIGLACVKDAALQEFADYMISCDTGAEVVTGSTRMKAGTATKLILNMISTSTMIKAGKTYGNLMIDVNPSNIKLNIRARRIFRTICEDSFYLNADGTTAKEPQSIADTEEGNALIDDFLRKCGSIKVAVVVAKSGVSISEAEKVLISAGGELKKALASLGDSTTSQKETESQDILIKNLCVDIIENKIQAALFDGNDMETKYTTFDNLTDDLSAVVRGLAFGASIDLKSVRVAYEYDSQLQEIKQVLSSFGIPEHKISLIKGRADLVDLVSSMV